MPKLTRTDTAAPGRIVVRSPYKWRFLPKRIFHHKPLFGSAVDHAIIRTVGDACVRILRRDPDRLFSSIEIETVNRCNSTCSFCPVNTRTDVRPLAHMSDRIFTKVIDELSSLGYSGKISLHSNNEPLLDEKIVERVRYAKTSCPDAFVFFYTNGTLLSTELAWQLIQAGIDFIRVNNYSDKLTLHKNIQALVKDFEGLPLAEHATKIRIVVRKLNEVLSNRGGAAPNKSPDHSHAYRYYQTAMCRYPFDQLVIRPDGKVSLCGNDAYGQITMGDVDRQSVTEIWFGKDYRRLRAELSANGRRNLPLCNTCDVHTFDPDAFLARSRLLRAVNRFVNLSSYNWK
jgi:radical SAM protein with 4Fe4S-binding SPASM domain